MRPINLSKLAPESHFTGLDAHIVEEDGAFTVRVRMLNHKKQSQQAWGEEIAATIDVAIAMVGSLASEFAIPAEGRFHQDCNVASQRREIPLIDCRSVYWSGARGVS